MKFAQNKLLTIFVTFSVAGVLFPLPFKSVDALKKLKLKGKKARPEGSNE